MSNNSWNQTLVTLQSAGPANTGTTATTLLNTQAQFTFPANLLKIGDHFAIHAKGIMSTTTTATNCTFTIVNTTASVNLFSSGTIALYSAGTLTGVSWSLDVDILVRSVGNAATVWSQGVASSSAFGTLTTTNEILNLPVSSLAVSSSFNSATSFVIDFQNTMSVATTITCEQYRLIYET